MPNVDPSFYYDMSGKKYLCIFNHEIYHNDTGDFQKIGYLSRRHGTRVDVENLTNTFKALGYKVAVYNDLRHEEIISKLAAFCQSDHSETSCVAVAILTHGRDSNQLMASDKPYRLTELCNILHNGNLAGKPKILFIQACRHGHDTEKPSVYYPTPPDFLIMHASVADYVSFRSKEEGSYLIRNVCEVLKELTESGTKNGTSENGTSEKGTLDRLSYADFVTRVNQRVSSLTTSAPNSVYHNKKQIPETIVTLMKSFVFWPKTNCIDDEKQVVYAD